MLVVLDRRRPKLNGLYPVKVEVVSNRKQKYYPAGIDLSPEEWTEIWDLRRKSEERNRLEEAFFRVARETDSLVRGERFSFRALDQRMGLRRSGVTLNSMLQRMADSFMDEGRTNSSYRCRSTLRAVEQYAGAAVRLPEVTPEWLRGCEGHWRQCSRKVTTVSIYMKTIKAVMNLAVAEGLLSGSGFPFGGNGYRIPSGTGRKLALSGEQIRRIMEFKGSPELEESRDLWLFSYLCNGINFRDMVYLKYGNIVNDEIWFVRSKTRNSPGAKTVRAALTGRMREIMESIGNPCDGNPDTLIFRCADGSSDDFHRTMHVRKVVSRCNRALAKIASELGIPKFTTYSARHSFASMLNWRGVDISYISESLGHSSLSVTERYLAGFSHADRVRNAALLTDFQEFPEGDEGCGLFHNGTMRRRRARQQTWNQ